MQKEQNELLYLLLNQLKIYQTQKVKKASSIKVSSLAQIEPSAMLVSYTKLSCIGTPL